MTTLNSLHLRLELLCQHLAVLSEGVQGSGHLHSFAMDLASLNGRDPCLGACIKQILATELGTVRPFR